MASVSIDLTGRDETVVTVHAAGMTELVPLLNFAAANRLDVTTSSRGRDRSGVSATMDVPTGVTGMELVQFLLAVQMLADPHGFDEGLAAAKEQADRQVKKAEGHAVEA